MILWLQKIKKSSQKHHRGMLDEALDLGKKLRADGPIDDAMVAGQTEVHAQAGDDLAVFDDGLFHGCADREDGGLRGVDNGIEGLNAPGAEVGNGDGATVSNLGLSLRSLARVAKSLTSREMVSSDLVSACLTTGVTRPSSTAMATDRPMCLNRTIESPANEALTAGTAAAA